MEEIALEQKTYQSVTHIADGRIFGITLMSFGSDEDHVLTVATVTLDGTEVATSLRCVPGGWLIPYRYLTDDAGNFRFVCDNDEYPFFKNFGGTCRLMYYTPDEYASETEG